MVQLIRNPQVTVIKEVVSAQDGKCEVTIKLDLNINVEGTLAAVLPEGVALERKVQPSKKIEQDEGAVQYTIPDFQLQKIKFGEKVG